MQTWKGKLVGIFMKLYRNISFDTLKQIPFVIREKCELTDQF